MSWTSINPATGETLNEYPKMNAARVDEIIRSAHAAQRTWRRTGFQERGPAVRNAAELLRERAGEYGRLMTSEMGKPLADSRGEVEKCARVCEYYAEHAEQQLAPMPDSTRSEGFTSTPSFAARSGPARYSRSSQSPRNVEKPAPAATPRWTRWDLSDAGTRPQHAPRHASRLSLPSADARTLSRAQR